MTKTRDPMTFEDALHRICSQLGYARAAHLIGERERTLRDWSDPDSRRSLPIAHAAVLDRAFLAAGGNHAPLADVLTYRSNAAPGAPACHEAIRRHTREAIHESADADVALFAVALQPDCRATAAAAAGEVQQVVAAYSAAMPHLLALQMPP